MPGIRDPARCLAELGSLRGIAIVLAMAFHEVFHDSTTVHIVLVLTGACIPLAASTYRLIEMPVLSRKGRLVA